jgi:hypothetical protein
LSSDGWLELQFVQRPQRFQTGLCSVIAWKRSSGCQLGENNISGSKIFYIT